MSKNKSRSAIKGRAHFGTVAGTLKIYAPPSDTAPPPGDSVTMTMELREIKRERVPDKYDRAYWNRVKAGQIAMPVFAPKAIREGKP